MTSSVQAPLISPCSLPLSNFPGYCPKPYLAMPSRSPKGLETPMPSPAPASLQEPGPGSPNPPRQKKTKPNRRLGMMHSSRPQSNNRNSNLSSIGEFLCMEPVSTPASPAQAQPEGQLPGRSTEAALIETTSPPSLESTYSTHGVCTRIIEFPVNFSSEDERRLMTLPGAIDNDFDRPGACHHKHVERHLHELEDKQEPCTWKKCKTCLHEHLHLWAWEPDWMAQCKEKKRAKRRKCEGKREWREIQKALDTLNKAGKIREKARSKTAKEAQKARKGAEKEQLREMKREQDRLRNFDRDATKEAKRFIKEQDKRLKGLRDVDCDNTGKSALERLRTQLEGIWTGYVKPDPNLGKVRREKRKGTSADFEGMTRIEVRTSEDFRCEDETRLWLGSRGVRLGQGEEGTVVVLP